MTKTVTLLASGTRGDVQPYVALGIALRDAGYHVCVAAHDAFAPLVKNWDLEFFSLGENPSDLFAARENENALRAGRNPFTTLRASFTYWRNARPVYAQLVQRAWQAAQNSDALIFGLPTFWASELASAQNIPGIQAFLQPLTPTRAFPCPLLPVTRSFGAFGNRVSYALVWTTLRWAWRDALQTGRRDLHIAPSFAANAPTTTLYGLSETFVPRPRDYAPQQHITGYWFLPERAYAPPDALEAFLRAGAPPVYLGFGSITPYAKQNMVAILTELSRKTRLRFVIPRAFWHAALARENFFAVDDVPHAWLYPRVRAAIHHGGAGTTASALRAGIPQIILPMYADTFFWGSRVFATGIGPRPLPAADVSADALAYRIEETLQSEQIAARARALSKKIARENGALRAVELLRAQIET